MLSPGPGAYFLPSSQRFPSSPPRSWSKRHLLREVLLNKVKTPAGSQSHGKLILGAPVTGPVSGCSVTIHALRWAVSSGPRSVICFAHAGPVQVLSKHQREGGKEGASCGVCSEQSRCQETTNTREGRRTGALRHSWGLGDIIFSWEPLRLHPGTG